MMGHGALMLCLGLATCTLASLMASPAFAELGYAIAVVLSASCLVIVGIYLGELAFGERSYCPIANYLLVGLLSIACWLMFWLLASAPTELRLLTLLAGMHGIVWSLWYVRLAFYLKAFPKKAALLSILAATTSFLGIALATESELTQLSATAVAAYYTMFIGIQILLSTLYLYREFEIEGWSLRSPAHERKAVSVAANSRVPHVQNSVTQLEAEEKSVRVTVS
jgi:hypothetical protein